MRTIVIDAGHGGADPGSINKNYGFEEADFSLRISQALSKLAKGVGWSVKNTRQSRQDTPIPGNKNADLLRRASIANEFKANVFISIHLNATPSAVKNARGFELFIQKGDGFKSQLLAEKIGQAVRRQFPSMRYRYGNSNSLYKEGNYAVLRNATMPAVLVECGFMDNDEDALFFSLPSNVNTFARALFDGLDSWFISRGL